MIVTSNISESAQAVAPMRSNKKEQKIPPFPHAGGRFLHISPPSVQAIASSANVKSAVGKAQIKKIKKPPIPYEESRITVTIPNVYPLKNTSKNAAGR